MINLDKVDEIAKDVDNYADELQRAGNRYSMDEVIDFLRDTFDALDAACRELSDQDSEIEDLEQRYHELRWECQELRDRIQDLIEERNILQDDLYAAECGKEYAEEELEALRQQIGDGE